MEYFRLSTSDTNFRYNGDTLVWDLPLFLDHTKVGLSSFNMELSDNSYGKQPEFVTLKLNLLEKTMYNQQGLLDEIPLFNLSEKSYVLKRTDVEFWETSRSRYNTVEIKLNMPKEYVLSLSVVLIFTTDGTNEK